MKIPIVIGQIWMVGLLFSACKKDKSFESDISFGSGLVANGQLSGNLSTCENIEVLGIYASDLSLDTSNRVSVEVNFSQTGAYKITTDTVNGFYFTDSATVFTTGLQRITLTGKGKPQLEGVSIFKVNFSKSNCSFSVKVYPLAKGNNIDYFPTSTGSNWRLSANNPLALPTDTALLLSTGKLVAKASNNYFVFTRTHLPQPDTFLYRKDNEEYRKYEDIDPAGIFAGPLLTDQIFLKAEVNQGTNWLSNELSGNLNGIVHKVRISYTLLEKDATLLMNGVAFTKVMKVRSIQQILPPSGVWQNAIAFETWYAFGIGIINLTTDAPLYGYRTTRFQIL